MMDIERVRERFTELVGNSGAVGAVFAVSQQGEISELACGLSNRDTGIEMTPDTIFEIASVSKVYTATLAMRLVDDGLLDLDAPIRRYLPSFTLADESVAARVTARHLLSHTSGIDGDKLDDCGRGDDAVERYVAECATLRQVHPLGVTQSYCNTGLVILGRIVEVLTGKPWSAAAHDLLVEPLGLRHTGTLPEELIWRRLAAPHSPAGDVLYLWGNSRSTGPCGGVSATAADVLRFAAVHLRPGPILSPASIAAMRSPQVTLPNPYGEATHWGLGWKLTIRDDQPLIISHGGANYGHQARLLCVPEHDFAAVVLVNSGGVDIDSVAQPLFQEFLSPLGLELPAIPTPVQPPRDTDFTPHAGTYRSLAFKLTLTADSAGLSGSLRLVTPDAHLLPADQTSRPITFQHVRENLFVSRFKGEDRHTPAVFFSIAGQDYLHIGGRALVRA